VRAFLLSDPVFVVSSGPCCATTAQQDSDSNPRRIIAACIVARPKRLCPQRTAEQTAALTDELLCFAALPDEVPGKVHEVEEHQVSLPHGLVRAFASWARPGNLPQFSDNDGVQDCIRSLEVPEANVVATSDRGQTVPTPACQRSDCLGDEAVAQVVKRDVAADLLYQLDELLVPGAAMQEGQ